jgi:hypothetical protein
MFAAMWQCSLSNICCIVALFLKGFICCVPSTMAICQSGCDCNAGSPALRKVGVLPG